MLVMFILYSSAQLRGHVGYKKKQYSQESAEQSVDCYLKG